MFPEFLMSLASSFVLSHSHQFLAWGASDDICLYFLCCQVVTACIFFERGKMSWWYAFILCLWPAWRAKKWQILLNILGVSLAFLYYLDANLKASSCSNSVMRSQNMSSKRLACSANSLSICCVKMHLNLPSSFLCADLWARVRVCVCVMSSGEYCTSMKQQKCKIFYCLHWLSSFLLSPWTLHGFPLIITNHI